MIKKSLKLPAIIRFFYYLLFIVTPLIMNSYTSEIFEFNKMIFIYFSTIIITGLFSIHYILKRPKLRLPIVFYIALLFFISQLISTLFSIDIHTSIWGYYGRWNGGLVSITSYLLLFFVFIQVFDKKHVFRLIKISVFTSFLTILWGIPGKFGHDLSCYLFKGEFTNTCWSQDFKPDIRMFSTLGQPNWLAAYLSANFYLGFLLFWKSLKNNCEDGASSVSTNLANLLTSFKSMFIFKDYSLWSWLYLSYLGLCLYVIFATGSRSGMIAVATSFFIGLVIIFTSNLKNSLKYLYRFIIISAFLAFLYFAISFGSSVASNLVPENLDITDSFTIRKLVWEGAVDLGFRYPLFGTGPQTFAYTYFFVKPEAHNLTSEWDFIYNKAHNEFLDYFATTGFFGLITYVLMIIFMYKSFFKESKKLEDYVFGLFLMLSFTTIQVTNFFGFSTSTVQLFFYLLPAFKIAFDKKNIKEKGSSIRTMLTNPLVWVVFFSIVYLSSMLLSYYEADLFYKQAKSAVYTDDYKLASQKLILAMRKKYDHVYEDELSSSLANLAAIMSFNGNNKDEIQNIIDLSKISSNKAIEGSPKNIRYMKTSAKNNYLYFQATGDTQDLKKSAAIAKNITLEAPNDAQSFYTLGLFYALLAQETSDQSYTEKAKEALLRALTLKPNFQDALDLLRSIS